MMDWGKQAETVLDAWLDAQRQWWEAWQGTAASPPTTDAISPLFAQWQALMQQTMAHWAGDAPVARQVAEQFIASQSAMMRFVELVTQA
jgi:hypothetical protein